MINSVTVGFFMSLEILRVGFLWIFQNQWGFLWWVFKCKSTYKPNSRLGIFYMLHLLFCEISVVTKIE